MLLEVRNPKAEDSLPSKDSNDLVNENSYPAIGSVEVTRLTRRTRPLVVRERTTPSSLPPKQSL